MHSKAAIPPSQSLSKEYWSSWNGQFALTALHNTPQQYFNVLIRWRQVKRHKHYRRRWDHAVNCAWLRSWSPIWHKRLAVYGRSRFSLAKVLQAKMSPSFLFFFKVSWFVEPCSKCLQLKSARLKFHNCWMVFTRKPCVFVDIHREPQWNVNRWASLRKEENLIQNTTDIVNYSENLKSSLGTEEWLSTESSPTAIKHWAPCTQHGSNFYGDFLWATDQF